VNATLHVADRVADQVSPPLSLSLSLSPFYAIASNGDHSVPIISRNHYTV